jgi:hypothetical protein
MPHPRLLEDYSPFLLPNALKNTLTGHAANVKCVEFVGEEGLTLASGSRFGPPPLLIFMLLLFFSFLCYYYALLLFF